MLLLGLKDFVEKTQATYAELSNQRVDQLRLYKHAKEIARTGFELIVFFRLTGEYAICYGNNYAGKAFGRLLTRLYPKALFFNVFSAKFETFTQYLGPKIELQKYDHLYFLGTPTFSQR